MTLKTLDIGQIKYNPAQHTHLHQTLVTRRGTKHTNPIQICAAPHKPTPTYHIPHTNLEALSLYAFDHSAGTSQSYRKFCLEIHVTW